MSKKVEIPQELMDKIIDCYVVQQLSLEKTIVTLQLPFSRNVLKRLLTEQGVHIRTYKEAANQGMRGEPPIEMQQQIIALYQQGYSIARIQKAIQSFYSSDKIKKILLNNNITLRTLEEAKKVRIQIEERKYPVNDNYCLESHNGAWLLGFVAADGYLPITKGAKYRITITLARKDEDILHLIAQELGYEGPIYQFTASDGVSLSSSLSFSSKILRQKFEEYGIVNNKTFQLKELPNLPKEYMLDFIRGYFDGDGSIYEPRGKKINTNFTSANKEFLENVGNYLHQELNLTIPTIHPSHNAFDIRYYVKDSLILCNAFYNNDYLALPRKKNHYKQIVSPTSLNTP